MKRYALTCDLKNDPALIREYVDHHKKIWTEIGQSIREKGILRMEIYLNQTRLFMVMDTADDFSFEKAAQLDASNPRVRDWENLMWKYQQSPPAAAEGEKWVLMQKIFDLGRNA